MSTIIFGILTVSDSCAAGKIDKSGQILSEMIKSSKQFDSFIKYQKVVPDNFDDIKTTLLEWISNKCHVILTTGGTGFSIRDITPEVTKSVIEREAAGLIQIMISECYKLNYKAILSRAVCGIKDETIIINLPGSPNGVKECFGIIEPILLHAVAVLINDRLLIDKHHSDNQICSDDASKVKINIVERLRVSEYPMVSIDDATNIIREKCKEINNEIIQIIIEESLDCILAEDIKSLCDLPRLNVSLKDGYAIYKITNMVNDVFVKNAFAAGDPPCNIILDENEGIRVCTGGPLPQNTTTVIQVEDTILKENEGFEEKIITIKSVPKQGANIRFKGSDVKADEVLFKHFTKIQAAHIGVMASFGYQKIKVYQQPKIGILSTGNEIVSHTIKRLKPGQIYDSNKLMLINMFRKYGYQTEDCGIARDEPNILKAALKKAFKNNNFIVTTGGVSMGEYDLIKTVLIEDFNATIHFGRVNMKPGKPTTFATLNYKGQLKIIFGLPGNPVSSAVTTILFVIPALKLYENNTNWQHPIKKVHLTHQITNNDDRPEFIRVDLCLKNSQLYANPLGDQTSSRLNSMINADGLLKIPGQTSTTFADLYECILIGDLSKFF